jgi:Trk-type K+ transport system membrane component
MMLCKSQSIAQKRYQRDVTIFMAVYLVLVLCSALIVKHGAPTHLLLYVCSVIPAVPIIGVIARMVRYLREETDEYQRLLRMESILAGTGATLAVLVVSDFLRSFANTGDLPPFTLFLVFALSMAAAELVQYLRNRVHGDE